MKSMTGIGRAQGVVQGVKFRLEIKSVNHRFCEVNVRAPSKFSALEILIQNHIKDKMPRGRVDLYINEEKSPDISPNEQLAYEQYHAYLKNIQQSLGLDDEVTLPVLVSGVSAWVQREVDAEKAWKEFLPVLDEALKDLIAMREAEGGRLKKNIQERMGTIQGIKSQIDGIKADLQQSLSDRLQKKISDKLSNTAELDPVRLHTEVLYYMDRLDISEELERLDSHFVQMENFVAAREPIGRKVDFLLQEFNREFNTIASKAQDSRVAHLVVDAKSELEKVREQIQNIE